MIRPATITAFLAELIETHMEKCDDVPHIVSSVDEQTATIEFMATTADSLTVQLSTGQIFVLSLIETR